MEKQTVGAEGVTMHDEMRRAFSQPSGKWKPQILRPPNRRLHGFCALRKAMPGITQPMLMTQVRAHEADEIRYFLAA